MARFTSCTSIPMDFKNESKKFLVEEKHTSLRSGRRAASLSFTAFPAGTSTVKHTGSFEIFDPHHIDRFVANQRSERERERERERSTVAHIPR